MSNYYLKISAIKKSFGERCIINDKNYRFESGKVYVLKGISGSGKTTLLNIMSGLLKPDKGYVETNFGKTTDRDWFKTKATYVFQNYALIDNDSVRKNLNITTRFKKENRNDEQYLSALGKVGLSNILDHKIYELSGGEQQRVAISRLFLRDYNVVFADEPTGNLDDGNTELIMESFKEIASLGKIVIITSHNTNIINQADIVWDLDIPS